MPSFQSRTQVPCGLSYMVADPSAIAEHATPPQILWKTNKTNLKSKKWEQIEEYAVTLRRSTSRLATTGLSQTHDLQEHPDPHKSEAQYNQPHATSQSLPAQTYITPRKSSTFKNQRRNQHSSFGKRSTDLNQAPIPLRHPKRKSSQRPLH